MSRWGGGGEGKIFLVPHQPSPVKYLITIQDGGIESLIYLAFRSKITAALQASQIKKFDEERLNLGQTAEFFELLEQWSQVVDHNYQS